MKIDIQITPEGGIRMLHSDDIDLSEFGPIEVTRASDVEFNNSWKHWEVFSHKTGDLLASGFPTRAEALDWEREYYSPGGDGWAELTKE